MICNYEKAFPNIIDVDNADWSGFIAKMDEYDCYIKNLIEGFETLYDYNRCPTSYLTRLGALISAGHEVWDTDYIKRTKIRDAIQRHKFSSTWTNDIKLTVEAISLNTATLYTFRDIAYWILDEARTLSTDLNWNVSRLDEAREFPNGLFLSEDRNVSKGIVFIDHGSAIISSDDLDKMEVEVTKSAPVYMTIYIGYYSSGTFTIQRTIFPT